MPYDTGGGRSPYRRKERLPRSAQTFAQADRIPATLTGHPVGYQAIHPA
ncbi:hypothetical protein [Spirillospora sp. NPDC029432]